MADRLAEGVAWLASQRAAHLSCAVSYGRGGEWIALDATIGRTTFEALQEDGSTLTFEARDFLFPAAQLVLANGPTTPRPGDKIRQGGQLYEVLRPAEGPAWRYSDPYRTTIRVHTKHVGPAEEPLP